MSEKDTARVREEPPPNASEVFLAVMLGSLYCYFGLLGLIALSLLTGTGDLARALETIGLGLSLGMIGWFIAALLIVAPLGTAIAGSLSHWFAPTRWHGAITGVLTAVTLGALGAVVFSERISGFPDAGTYAFLAGMIGISAGSGFYVQRAVLRWPRPNAQ